MTYLRVKIHGFDEMPKEEDIEYGSVGVITLKDGYIRPILYTVEKGWNTSKSESTGKYSTEHAQSIKDMKAAFDGWISFNKKTIVNDDWCELLKGLVEDVGIVIVNNPDTYQNDYDKEYWDELDSFYEKAEDLLDHAEFIQKLKGWQ